MCARVFIVHGMHGRDARGCGGGGDGGGGGWGVGGRINHSANLMADTADQSHVTRVSLGLASPTVCPGLRSCRRHDPPVS